jgi:hypothetical protein
MADSSGGLSAVESLLGDRYTREARLAPAFLSLFPVLLVLIISFKGLRDAIPALLSLLCVFGVVRWISHIARGIGDKKEIKLFRDWGGKPTTTMLRVALGYIKIEDTKYEDQVRHLLGEAPPGKKILEEIEQRKGVEPPTRNDDRSAAQAPAKEGVTVATASESAVGANKVVGAQVAIENTPAPVAPHVAAKKVAAAITVSDALDQIYEPTVAWMRENSRESTLVVEEEISYGFQRNFFALRRFAFLCAAASFIVEARAAHLQVQFAWQAVSHIDSPIAAVILTALAAYLLCLSVFVTENSVMVQGFIYARALLDSFYAAEPAKPDAKSAPEQPS